MPDREDTRVSAIQRGLLTVAESASVDRAHVQAMQQLCSSQQPVLCREHFEPGHFTASAFVLSPEEQRVLLILHGKLGLWLQPGGHIESSDDSYVCAALREVREETGVEAVSILAPLFDVDVHSIPAIGPHPSHLHHDLRVLLRAHSDHIVAGDDAVRARWFHFNEILRCGAVLADGAATDESVRRVTRRLLQRALAARA